MDDLKFRELTDYYILTSEEIRILCEFVRRTLIDYVKGDNYETISSFDDIGKIYLSYFKLKEIMRSILEREKEIIFGKDDKENE